MVCCSGQRRTVQQKISNENGRNITKGIGGRVSASISSHNPWRRAALEAGWRARGFFAQRGGVTRTPSFSAGTAVNAFPSNSILWDGRHRAICSPGRSQSLAVLSCQHSTKGNAPEICSTSVGGTRNLLQVPGQFMVAKPTTEQGEIGVTLLKNRLLALSKQLFCHSSSCSCTHAPAVLFSHLVMFNQALHSMSCGMRLPLHLVLSQRTHSALGSRSDVLLDLCRALVLCLRGCKPGATRSSIPLAQEAARWHAGDHAPGPTRSARRAVPM
eukprot:3576602-Rhodomonas_salina.1